MALAVPLLPSAHRVLHMAETVSTNAEAMRLGLQGEASGLWVMAGHQTGGKGRSGRAWASLSGNLQASLLIRLHGPPHRVSQLSLVSGVASHDAILRSGGLAQGTTLRLKWPNDILIGGAKTGGILVESCVTVAMHEVVAVAGFGLNLTAHPEIPGRPATHLNAHGAAITPTEMLAFLATTMQEWLDVWETGLGFQEVRAAWLQRCGPLGGPLTINTGRGQATGAFAGIDAEGALLLIDSNGQTRSFSYGDVSLSG